MYKKQQQQIKKPSNINIQLFIIFKIDYAKNSAKVCNCVNSSSTLLNATMDQKFKPYIQTQTNELRESTKYFQDCNELKI